MFYTKKERLLLFVKSFIIIFTGGLFIKVIFNLSAVSLLINFSTSLGLSIGVAFNDLFRNMFIKPKTTNEINIHSYLSLLMGIFSIPSFPLIIASLLGIFYGIPGLKTSKKRIAMTGIILSSLGLLLGIIFYAGCLYP
ncbi:MAG: hypothetical protein ACYDEJ_14905 [Desulfitobacteriaceae bacterium]